MADKANKEEVQVEDTAAQNEVATNLKKKFPKGKQSRKISCRFQLA